jgi:hypothetical protein
MKLQMKILATITIDLTLASAAGLLIVPATEQYRQAEAAKSATGECAGTLKNASATFCHRL